jgi:anaerobic selenocysteine-containing dehydrogenase
MSSHGMMHMVITNAVNHDPYALDTLILFMANMAWNSSMNTKNVQDMLREKDPEEPGQYKIPFLVVVDAFHSEMVNFADLVLPDTTYLERHDCISLVAASSRTTRISSSTTSARPASASSPAGAARPATNSSRASPTPTSGRSTSRTRVSSPTTGRTTRSTCAS